MKNVPNRTPPTIASNDQIRLPPPVTENVPTAMVAIWALLMNHRGPWLHTLPCRSSSGT